MDEEIMAEVASLTTAVTGLIKVCEVLVKRVKDQEERIAMLESERIVDRAKLH